MVVFPIGSPPGRPENANGLPEPYPEGRVPCAWPAAARRDAPLPPLPQRSRLGPALPGSQRYV